MNTAIRRPSRPTTERRKAKGAAILGDNATIGETSDPTLYSNGAPHLPRLGANAPNTRHKASAALSLSKATDLADAVEHAKKIGLPLVKFVTIHFAVAGLSETERTQEAVGKFLKLVSQWLRARGHQFAYIWVMERVVSIREHVHIMCSCPHALGTEFDKKAKGIWMAKAGMRTARQAKTGIRIERVGPRYHPSSYTWHASYDRESAGTLLYHLKGIDPDQCPTNDNGACLVTTSSGKVLAIEPEHEGTIFGRRCSRSENVGAKARRIHWAMQQPAAA